MTVSINITTNIKLISQSSSNNHLSAAKKRISQIDDSVAPLRLNSRPKSTPEPSQNTPSSPVQVLPSDANPFSVKSDEIRNTQRRSTSFLETIETKSLQQESKRKSLQPAIPEKTGLTLADLGKRASFQKLGKSDVKKMPTKKTKPKKKTGYALWFETQEGLEPKAGPLKWRHLPTEEKDKWLEQAKQQAEAKPEPSVSLVNTFKRSERSVGETSEIVVGEPVSDVIDENSESVSKTEVNSTEKDEDTEEKENVDSNKSEVTDSARTGKRKVSFETEEEDSESNPSKTKKLSAVSSGDISTGTKSKLAAFQFKKKWSSEVAKSSVYLILLGFGFVCRGMKQVIKGQEVTVVMVTVVMV